LSRDVVLDNHILNIVNSQEIHEQIDLQTMLTERGYDIPQATLSRKLKKLKIVKIAGVYKIVDFNPSYLPPILNLQVSDAGMMVLHTQPGNASSLASYLDRKYVTFSQDQKNTSGILGTIAGDDTILLILKNKQHLKSVLSLLNNDFPYLKDRN